MTQYIEDRIKALAMCTAVVHSLLIVTTALCTPGKNKKKTKEGHVTGDLRSTSGRFDKEVKSHSRMIYCANGFVKSGIIFISVLL